MKQKEQYQELKTKKSHHIILIKSGSFYITFLEDAIIFNYLFNYQIKDNKVGFPISVIDKTLFQLRQYELNYIIIDPDLEKPIEYTEYSIEQYQKILKSATKYEFEQRNNKILVEKVQYLLNINPNNYNKIKEFIDEL